MNKKVSLLAVMLVLTSLLNAEEPLSGKDLNRYAHAVMGEKAAAEMLASVGFTQDDFRARFKRALQTFRKDLKKAATREEQEALAQALEVHLVYPRTEEEIVAAQATEVVAQEEAVEAVQEVAAEPVAETTEVVAEVQEEATEEIVAEAAQDVQEEAQEVAAEPVAEATEVVAEVQVEVSAE